MVLSYDVSGYHIQFAGHSAFSDQIITPYVHEEVDIPNYDYTFLYSQTYPEKPIRRILVKCLGIDGELFVDVLFEGASEQIHLEVDVEEYVEDNVSTTNYESQFKNLGKLLTTIKREIFDKLDSTPALSSSSSQPPRSFDTMLRTNKILTRGFYDHEEPSYTEGIIFPSEPGPAGKLQFPGPILQVHPFKGDLWNSSGV